MKKIVLLACSMLLCAGIAMAQEPVKKPAKKAETTTVKSEKADAQVTHKGCGNCPNHKQCGKAADAKATAAKPESKECCKKEGQTACNKDAAKKDCKKDCKKADAKPAKK